MSERSSGHGGDLAAALAAAEAAGISAESSPEAHLEARTALERLAAQHHVPLQDLIDALSAAALLAGDTPDPVARWRQSVVALGGYELGAELGRGGMGVVYRARQRGLERDVAVKVLLPGELIFGEALARFQREARVLARLRHPHVVPIHEVGEAHGVVYFAMDLYEGGSLADLLRSKRRPMPVARVVRLVRQVAEAVAHVHAHGLVHRDLKPANVLLDEDGDAHVADFGLAVDPAEGATLTASGRLLGTPDYMAPEQARGERARITERTDVYALGVMLYECLVGRRPFDGRGFLDKVQAVVHEEPVAPRKAHPEVPRELERIVQQAMAKDPDRRYPTARALAEDLARFESGAPVVARGVTALERAGRVLRRHRAPLLVAAASAAALALVLHRTEPFEGPEDRLASATELEAVGEGRAARLLYLRELERLRGRSLDSEATRTLAAEGVASALVRLDEAPLAGRDAQVSALRRDTAWLAEQLGDDDVRTWLARVALEDREAATTSWRTGFEAWLLARAGLSGGSSRDVAETTPRAALVELAPFVSDPEHGFAGAAVRGAFMLLMRDGSAQALTALGPEVWRRLAIALLSAPAVEQDPSRVYGALVALQRGLGEVGRHPALRDRIVALLADPAAPPASHLLASELAEALFDAPPVTAAEVRQQGRGYTTVGRRLDERSRKALADALRETAGASRREERERLAALACGLLDAPPWPEEPDVPQHVRHQDAQIWLMSRCALAWPGEDRVWTRSLADRGGLAGALDHALGLASPSVDELLERLAVQKEDTTLRWLHERMLLLAPPDIVPPCWPSDRGGLFPPPPKDLVSAWHAALGVGATPAFDVAFGVLVLDDAGAPRLATHGLVSVPSAGKVTATLPFQLVAPEAPAVASLELARQRRGSVEGITVAATLAGHDGVVVGRSVGSELLPLGHANAALEAELPRGPRRRHVLPADRVAVLVLPSTDAPSGFDRASLQAWLDALARTAVTFGDEEVALPVPALEYEVDAHPRRVFWGSATPRVLARFIGSLDSAEIPWPATFATGLTSRSWSLDEVLGVRALELALGRFDESAVSAQLDQFHSRRDADEGAPPLLLPNAGALLSHPSPEVRRYAAEIAEPTRVLAGELVRADEVWRSAGEALPPRLAACLPPTGWGAFVERLGSFHVASHPGLAAGFALVALSVAAFLVLRGRRR